METKNRKEYHRKYREANIEKRRKWNKEWIEKNKDRYNASKYLYRERLKETVMLHYGLGVIECADCCETDIDVLCIDHIDNNGAEHRKQAGISGRGSAGTSTYEALKRDDYPEGLQILCANCNLKKEQELKRANRMKNKFYRDRTEVVPDV